MKDLTQFMTQEEREEFSRMTDGMLCGSHPNGILCRDCLGIFAVRAMREIRKQFEAYKKDSRPRLIHRAKHTT